MPRSLLRQKNASRECKRHRWLWRVVGLGANVLCGCGIYGWLSSRPETTRHRRDVGLGLERPLRVAAVSDLHLDGKLEDFTWVVEAVRREKPALFVIVGDSLERRSSLPMFSLFSEIEAPLGKYASIGNWEYLSGVDPETLAAHYREVGVRLLVNETADVGGLRLVGLDDWREGEADLSLVHEASRLGPSLVLSHCPLPFGEVAATTDPAAARRLVVLAGHTHAGQLAPFGLVLYVPPGSGRYVSGWYEHHGAHLYVMRGVGYSGPRLRLGPRPELTVLDLL